MHTYMATLLRRGPTIKVNIHNTHVLPRRIEVVAAYMRVWMHPYMTTLLRRGPTFNVRRRRGDEKNRCQGT